MEKKKKKEGQYFLSIYLFIFEIIDCFNFTKTMVDKLQILKTKMSHIVETSESPIANDTIIYFNSK